jgi:fido (protein-threonine AMPylation protein)
VPVPWDEDPPGYEGRTLENADAVLRSIVAASDQRDLPTVAMAQDWHRGLYDGIPLPVSYYSGEVRDSDDQFPELVGYEVSVGLLPGAPSADVLPELANFERQAQIAVGRIDSVIPVGAKPAAPSELGGVITLCALMHGEWVRIHPFANGNGRTARLWANWTAVRYGLPPFVTITPRPGSGAYRQAAVASMSGDHAVAVAVFGALFRSALTT